MSAPAILGAGVPLSATAFEPCRATLLNWAGRWLRVDAVRCFLRRQRRLRSGDRIPWAARDDLLSVRV
jgi:hypothetical protein